MQHSGKGAHLILTKTLNIFKETLVAALCQLIELLMLSITGSEGLHALLGKILQRGGSTLLDRSGKTVQFIIESRRCVNLRFQGNSLPEDILIEGCKVIDNLLVLADSLHDGIVDTLHAVGRQIDEIKRLLTDMVTIGNGAVEDKLTVLDGQRTKMGLLEVSSVRVLVETDTKAIPIHLATLTDQLCKLLLTDELVDEVLLVDRQATEVQITLDILTGKITVTGILHRLYKQLILRDTMVKVVSNKSCAEIIAHALARHHLSEQLL